MILEDILLKDGNFVAAPDGDGVTVKGSAVVVQDVMNEIATQVSSLRLDLEYGSRILRFIQAENDPVNRMLLTQEIRQVPRRHPWVESASVVVDVVSWDMKNIEVSVEFNVRQQPMSTAAAARAALVVIIDQEGVRATGGIA